jgi:acetyl/propionyl-CoA carboxylase alpha subunit
MFNKVVVANRGAVAARVLRALHEMGIQSVAVYSEADYGAPYLEMAGETYAIGAAPALEAFDIKGPKTNIPAVLAILRSGQFRSGQVHTGIIPEVLAQAKKS